MSLAIGIVGLPNVGKSTLFNALVKTRQATASNFAFCTIDPNIGIVNVPDQRLNRIYNIIIGNIYPSLKRHSKSANRRDEESKTNIDSSTVSQNDNYKLPKIIPATVEFIDIAGLVKEAHKGEGLGNKFLGHIRNVDAICMVLRCFHDPNIMHVSGSINPKDDFETIKTELELADISSLDKIKNKKENTKDKNEDEIKLDLLATKPVIFALNVSEEDAGKSANELIDKFNLPKEINEKNAIVISAKVEEDLIDLDPDEQKEYLGTLGLKHSGLDRLVKSAYDTLGLQSFFTAGPKEVHAWTIKKGAIAPEAAGKIHTDFEHGFIRAEVISYDDFIKYNGEKGAREAGKLRSEGKEYIVKDGDVIEFRFNV